MLAVLATGASAAASPPQDLENRIARAHASSTRLLNEIAAIEGVHGVTSARTHDGVELIFAWFENRQAVLRWFRSDYHRQILREARRPEDGIAADGFGDDVGPILVVATASYAGQPLGPEASMFDDPAGRMPTSFSIEYYTPLPGGAYRRRPFAPMAVAGHIEGIRDITPRPAPPRSE
jgi:heme-degrading monooxygenase HmoA